MRCSTMMRMKKMIVFVAFLAAVALVSSANAALLHRYSFNGDANDSVGTANGTLMNGATISGGALVTAAGGSQWGGTGAYCALDPSAVSGINGAFTVEGWFQITNHWPPNSTLFSFTDDATVAAPGGSSASYFFGTPVQGDWNFWPCDTFVVGAGGAIQRPTWDAQMTGNPPGSWGDDNQLHQLLTTYDGTTFTMYVDGVIANHVPTLSDAGFNLSSLTDIGLNGGNPYGDPALNGSQYDFRIYSGAVTADQVASVYALGSDASNSDINLAVVPEPSTIALLVAGIFGLLFRRLRKR